MSDASLYQRLAAPFDKIQTREQAGQTFRYITGEQCISRLNEECGSKGWSFKVVEHGRDTEADEVWALVELTIMEDGTPSTAFGFGSQKIKRRFKTAYNKQTGQREQVRDNQGNPIVEVLNLGQDMKGAMTDALKVAAKHFGVALYLYDKDDAGDQGEHQHGGYAPRPQQSNGTAPRAAAGGSVSLECADCGNEITGGEFKDGKTFTAQQAAGWGQSKYGRALCSQHYRDAAAQARRAEAANQSVPF